MTKRRAFASLLLVLGGGVFVVAGVAWARAVLRRRGAHGLPEPLPAPPAPSAEADPWVQMPPGTVPLVEPPPVTPVEQVMPHAREPEDVVERLVPESLRPRRRRRFLDFFLALVVLALAGVAVLAIVRVP